MKGKSVLVIGGSSGIGLALAKGFGAAGARITLMARRREHLESAVADLAAEGIEAGFEVVDATDIGALSQAIGAVGSKGGGFDCLVNSQGTTIIQPAVDFTPDQYDQILDVNLKSVYFACLAAHQHFLRKGSGAIVNIASLAAHRGWPRSSVYAVSKHGVLALTRSLAAEWAEENIRVNSISPGFFMTELNQAKMSEERKERALSRTPANRFGKVEELQSAALFLAADASGFITGTDVAVDGGYLATGI